MLYHSCSDPAERFSMWLEIFIKVFQYDRLGPHDIFPDLRDAQTSFIIRPLNSFQVFYMRIDESFLNAGFIREFSFFILIHMLKYLLGVYHKHTDIFVYLGGS